LPQQLRQKRVDLADLEAAVFAENSIVARSK
jgi:hypothetical protein